MQTWMLFYILLVGYVKGNKEMIDLFQEMEELLSVYEKGQLVMKNELKMI